MKKDSAVEWLGLYIKGITTLNCDDIINQAKAMERYQKHESIEKQVSILKSTLEEMMTGFDSEEDRIDFILDICNGYNKRINL